MSILKSYWKLSVVLLLAFLLRFHNYAQFPIVGETADEFAWTALGASLIQTGTPASWSLFPMYEDHLAEPDTLETGAGAYPLVSPVFDHPPIFAFFPGIAHALKGTPWYESASAKVMRFPLLVIGTLNVFLVYLVARKLFENEWYRVLPTILYATAPLFVFSSRLVLAENFLSTIVLLSLVVMYSSWSERKKFWLLALLSCVAVLTKAAGVVVPGSILVYGLINRNSFWKSGIIGAAAGMALFALYGAWYNWSLFVEALTTQTNRGFGFITLYNRVSVHPAIAQRYYIDGWLITGLASMVVVMHEAVKKFIPVIIFFVANVLFVAFFVGEQTLYAWYDFTVYPLLALAIGYVLAQILEKKRYLLLGAIWILLLPMFRYGLLSLEWYYPVVEGFSWIGRGIVVAGFLPWFVSYLAKGSVARNISLALVGCIVLANIVTVIAFRQDIYWLTDDQLYYRGYIYPDLSND